MEPGQSYHIYNHANGMENIFREEENYRFFLRQYAKMTFSKVRKLWKRLVLTKEN